MSTVTYTNTRVDLLAFTAFHYLRSPWTWIGMAALIVFTLPPIIASVPWRLGLVFGGLMVFIFEAAVVTFVIAVMIATVLASVVLRDGAGVFTEHVLSFDQQGITERTDINASVFTWQGIQKVVRASDYYIFIYVTPGMAHLIPRRAVASDDDWDRLFDQVWTFYQGARA
ncbi:MAG: YcxB family protein [Coriobacteriia bacterium]|nr:YcxB family protein [Coriobacteriia bacterium]